MKKADNQYLAAIIADNAVATKKKYLKGQKEHGGHLWEKPGMLQNLEEELTDGLTYAYTIRYQLVTVLLLWDENPVAAKDLLKDILYEPEKRKNL